MTTPLAVTEVTSAIGEATRAGGFMQVPLLLPLGMTQVRPRPAQHAVAPVLAEVQPVAPIILQAGDKRVGELRNS